MKKKNFIGIISNSKIYLLFFLTFTCILKNETISQPSGGPYGPIYQVYDIPKVSGKIYFVSPDGIPENSGESISEPTTIEKAISKAKTGDAIILRGGVYRTGNLVFNQGIIIQSYKDEQPVFKGTYVATDWKSLGNGLWITKWDRLFPSKPADWWMRDREGKKTPLHRFNNDMVFVNGKFLQSAGWEGEVDENSYYIDYDRGVVYIGTDPTNKLVEITAFDAALIRTTKEVNGMKPDKKGPKIKGITFTQYAYRALEVEGTEPEGPADEKTFGKDVVGTLIENCTITFCSRVAGYIRGDSLVIRHCKVSDTSTEGIYIISSNDVLLEKNIFTRNNIERITGYYPAAVKIFNQCHRVTCNDNLVIDLPYSNGIWYDVGNVDGVFINNWIENVGNNRTELNINQPWPSDNGFFFEISKGAICAGNVFVNCDHGIWVLNSSNVKVYNNTFINSTACISRNARVAAGDHFGWHASTGPDIDKREGHEFVNNLLYADADFKRPLLYVWQPAQLCDKLIKPQLNILDYNYYVRQSNNYDILILWSPFKNEKCQSSFKNLEDLKNLYPQFAKNSKYYADYDKPIFKSFELHDFHLLKSFADSTSGSKVPEFMKKFIKTKKSYIGAYPVD
ncbi:right-handed parallel beta-helix repeat-containing protein [Rosettibacter firmus]|uniref:right-handed parallel beta-helix repeat-containing protein n=1 Tax=Rosettibacter firmus TaxID=3111522 RepID=UPI00336C2C17